MRGALRTAVHVVALAVGVALLALMVAKAGPQRLWAETVRGGPALLLVLPVSFGWFALNTYGWRLALAAPAPIALLFRAHVAAEALNNVTPFMALGGEPLKPSLLQERIATEVVIASVIGDNVVHALSAPLFMVAGLVLGAIAFPIEHTLLSGIFLATAVLGLLAAGLWLGGGSGLVGALSRAAARRLGRADARWAEQAVRVDALTRSFLDGRTWRFWASLGVHLAARLLGVAEALFIMAALGEPFSFSAAMLLIAVAHVGVNLVFSIIPSQVGVQETAAYLIFAAIGLDPASAIALMLIRRVRSIVWIAIGLMLLIPKRRPSA
jgi:uncharacterized protein (TIRG00374 family)